MGQKKDFLEQPIDRTPYSGCAWLAACILLLFWLGAHFLWNLAGIVKQGHSWRSGLSSDPALTKQVEDALEATPPSAASVSSQASQALDAAKQQAADAAAQEAKRQAQQQIDSYGKTLPLPTLP